MGDGVVVGVFKKDCVVGVVLCGVVDESVIVTVEEVDSVCAVVDVVVFGLGVVAVFEVNAGVEVVVEGVVGEVVVVCGFEVDAVGVAGECVVDEGGFVAGLEVYSAFVVGAGVVLEGVGCSSGELNSSCGGVMCDEVVVEGVVVR